MSMLKSPVIMMYLACNASSDIIHCKSSKPAFTAVEGERYTERTATFAHLHTIKQQTTFKVLQDFSKDSHNGGLSTIIVLDITKHDRGR